jgi:HD-GYP domain-containing protein (c-di-GMP phosphodiesterase class II)
MAGESKATDRPAQQATMERYMPVHLQSLWIDSIVEFDLYLYNGQEMVLYRAAHLPFTVKTREALRENGVNRLYIDAANRHDYQKYIQTYIDRILAEPSIDDFTKTSIVYDSAKELVKDVFANPTLAENIDHSRDLVQSTVLYVLEGTNVFHNMLRVMSFDYTLYTHSVNVCIFSLALAYAAGFQDNKTLFELGTGALLHDVGKVRVSDAILNKRGPLEPEEMEMIKHHPQWGVEIIQVTDRIPEASYLPIRQHHERENATGYPDGLRDGEIHLYGKIVAIADMFDAMTTERVYRPAVESFTALKTMFNEKDGLDEHLLRQFALLMGPTPLGKL